MISTKPNIHQIDEEMLTDCALVGSPPDNTRNPHKSLTGGHHTKATILMADDDSDDRLIAQEAWEEINSGNELRFVEDGQEVLDYVFRQGPYAEQASAPRPGIILLDLNMPKKNGHEVLRVIKTHTTFQTIPTIVFTTTKNIDEVLHAYKEGANAFMTKPATFEGYRNTLLAVDYYWLNLVHLPQV